MFEMVIPEGGFQVLGLLMVVNTFQFIESIV